MTLTLNLAPEQHKALRRHAEAEGTDVGAVLHGLIAALMPHSVPEGPEEDLEERAERGREEEELRANLNR